MNNFSKGFLAMKISQIQEKVEGALFLIKEVSPEIKILSKKRMNKQIKQDLLKIQVEVKNLLKEMKKK